MITDEPVPCQSGDPDRFFPNGGTLYGEIEKVKAECLACPLLEPCREWAIVHGELGIWGATTAPERHAIRRHRGIRVRHIDIDVVTEVRAAWARSLVARGFTVGEVAEALHLSPSGASQAVAKAKRRAS